MDGNKQVVTSSKQKNVASLSKHTKHNSQVGIKRKVIIKVKTGINGVAILILTILLTFGLAILFYFVYKNKFKFNLEDPIAITTIQTRIKNKSSWTQSVDIAGSDRSGCKIYEFINPTTPSYLKEIVDSVSPTSSTNGCLLSNQIYAKLSQRTCQGGGDQGFGCTGNDGQEYPPGTNEIFYQPCVLQQCTATIDLISVPHYTVTNTSLIPAGLCLTNNNNIAIALPCSPSISKQLFYVQRFNPDGVPNPEGSLAVLKDSKSGLCLLPDGTGTLGYYPCISNNPAWALLPDKSFGACPSAFTEIDINSYPTNTGSIFCDSTNLKSRFSNAKSSHLPCYQNGNCKDTSNNNVPGTILSSYDPSKIIPQQFLFLDSFIDDLTIFTNPAKFKHYTSLFTFRTIQLDTVANGYQYKLLPMATNTYQVDAKGQILDIFTFDTIISQDISF